MSSNARHRVEDDRKATTSSCGSDTTRHVRGFFEGVPARFHSHQGKSRARGDASACAANDNDASVTQRNVIGRRPLFTLPLAGAALTGASGRANADPSEFASDAAMAVLERRGEIAFTEDEWKAKLEPFTYKVLRKEATERPFSSELNTEKRTGTFVCAGCGTPLFDSSTKYDSGTGWPSFYRPLSDANIVEKADKLAKESK